MHLLCFLVYPVVKSGGTYMYIYKFLAVRILVKHMLVKLVIILALVYFFQDTV